MPYVFNDEEITNKIQLKEWLKNLVDTLKWNQNKFLFNIEKIYSKSYQIQSKSK